jgi:uridine kinase
MASLVASPQHEQLRAILVAFVQPWRKLTIAVDGRDGSGKSTLARYLAWQLQMPCIESDFCLSQGCSRPSWDSTLLSRLVAHRHELDRPVIVEGIFVLRNLESIGVEADFVVHVSNPALPGTEEWAGEFANYEGRYYPRQDHFAHIVTPAEIEI